MILTVPRYPPGFQPRVRRVSVLGACGRGCIRKVENRLTVLLKHLAREDLSKDISRVDRRRHQLDGHDAGSTHLAHFEQLTIDMPRVLG